MLTNQTPAVSFVLPCLNEARTVVRCVEMAKEFLRASGYDGEVIVADNGSTDGSQVLAEAAGARVVPVDARGYGAALAGGIAAARGEYVVMGDSDASYDFREAGKLIDTLRAGSDVVIGNRFEGGIAPGAMPFLHRWLGNPVLSFIGRLFFNIKVGDFHCGLRGFRRQAIADLDLRTTGMEYASEMIVRAALAGLKIGEAPVTLSKDGRDHPPHLQTWRDGWRHLRFLLLYSPRWLYLYPGIFMILFGLFVAALLLPGPFMVAPGVGLDVHTLLVGALALLVGVQSITFALLARQYAVKQGMLPPNSAYERWFALLSVERLLLLALVILVIGGGGVLWAARIWSAADFGALDYRDVMRIMIASATCIVGGLQLGFAAFMLGIMDIRHRRIDDR
ncbi:MAG: glycosyltransferase family 2 protein [Alphaproteobacteria bacterium]